jgi:hypothetical protein
VARTVPRSLRRLAARAAPVALAGAIGVGTAALLAVGDGSPRPRGAPGAGDRSPTAAAAIPVAPVAPTPDARPAGAATEPPPPAAGAGTGGEATPSEPETAAVRIQALRDAARRAPRDGEARRALGVELIESGEVDEGARLLVEATRLLDRDALEEHGVPMLRLLHANAREEEEALVRERIEELGL